jgi:hypothetical protein
MNPKTAVKPESVSCPFDFMTKTMAAIATAMNMQNIIIVGASKKPIFFLFINEIPVMIKAGKQMAISKT